jgi:hypothetical protein
MENIDAAGWTRSTVRLLLRGALRTALVRVFLQLAMGRRDTVEALIRYFYAQVCKKAPFAGRPKDNQHGLKPYALLTSNLSIGGFRAKCVQPVWQAVKRKDCGLRGTNTPFRNAFIPAVSFARFNS